MEEAERNGKKLEFTEIKKENYPKRLHKGIHCRHGSFLRTLQMILKCSQVLRTTASGQHSYFKKERRLRQYLEK